MIVNLGCGSQVVEGWVNVDYALGARLAKVPLFRTLSSRLGLFRHRWDNRVFIHDLRKPFPWADGSVDAAYTSHTLEHLTKAEGRRFLIECHRVLRKEGILRVVVPDLLRIVRKYVEGRLAADDFVEGLGVLYPETGSRLKRRLAPFIHFPHRCMYDEKRLLEILSEVGFDASPRRGLDSDIPGIELTGESGAQVSIVVEGRKR